MKFIFLFLFSASAVAAPGDFFGELFAPGFGNPVRARVEYRGYGQRHAAGSSFGLQQSRSDATVPLASSESASWRAQAFADYDSIESSAIFSNGRLMPSRLWDVGGGVSYNRQLEGEKSLSSNLIISSPSDRPFGAFRDTGFALNFAYKVPSANKNAWLYFVGVSNTRNFLNYIPLPGIAYFFGSNPRIRMMVGIPILWMYWLPADNITVSAFLLPVRNAELKVAYGSARGIQPYLLTRYSTRNYHLANRPADSAERLFFDEGLAQAGVSSPVARWLVLDVSGGVSFARRYYLAEKATQRTGAPGISADNAPFFNVKIAGSF